MAWHSSGAKARRENGISISSLPDLIRQSMQPVRWLDRSGHRCGAPAWTTGSSPVVTSAERLRRQVSSFPPTISSGQFDRSLRAPRSSPPDLFRAQRRTAVHIIEMHEMLEHRHERAALPGFERRQDQPLR